MRDHEAPTASRHWFAASARKIRSVERETRWRWRSKVLWTAACMLRNRWAERADLNRCILRYARRLQGSITLLRGEDKNFDPRLEFALVTRYVGDDRDISRNNNFLLSTLVLYGQRQAIDPGDSLLNIGVSHRTLGPKIPWALAVGQGEFCGCNSAAVHSAKVVGFGAQRLSHVGGSERRFILNRFCSRL